MLLSVSGDLPEDRGPGTKATTFALTLPLLEIAAERAGTDAVMPPRVASKPHKISMDDRCAALSAGNSPFINWGTAAVRFMDS
jgi:hypothetical protein